MQSYTSKTQENQSKSIVNNTSKMQSSESTLQFADNRPETIAQRKLQDKADNSPQAKRVAQFQTMANSYGDRQQQPINNTGLPDNLKSGIENLSGIDMSDTRVHYNSPKPAQLQAHAYAQGTDIHIASGQEKHLPHEAWHVVQQKQGRVKPTMQMKGEININDDTGLEKEADVMGAKALNPEFISAPSLTPNNGLVSQMKTIQRAIDYNAGVPQFEIDGKKPSFMGPVKNMVLLVSESRDHIVPYAAIENDLAVLLNSYITAAAGAAPVVWTQLQNLTEALFPNKGPGDVSYQTMVTRRNTLHATLTAGTVADYQKHARALLSALNSSSDNVRAGDSIINSSIGESLDADFLPGVSTVAAGGLNVSGAAGPVLLPAGTQYLRLEPNSEVILWEYQTHTTQALSFVLDPASNKQLSSVDEPAHVAPAGPASVAGKPVIVFPPAGSPPGTLPFYYA